MSIFPQGSFIFDASKGETPQTIARKREIADRIMYGRRRSPQNIGEGIAALGDGIVAGVLNRRANKAEEAGFAWQGELRDQIIRMMTGGQDLPFPPAPGGESPSGGSNAASAGGALPSSFLSAVDRYEGAGGYDTLFGHAQRGPFSGTDVSQMSVGEAMAFANPRGAYGQHVKGQIGRVATPMGRHQIVGTTLRNASREMGLDPATPFNAGTQVPGGTPNSAAASCVRSP